MALSTAWSGYHGLAFDDVLPPAAPTVVVDAGEPVLDDALLVDITHNGGGSDAEAPPDPL